MTPLNSSWKNQAQASSKGYVVHVTARDIAKGKAGNRYECPVAFAVSRRLKTFCEVTPRTVRVGNTRFRVPFLVGHIISMYDAGYPMIPFRFVLTAPKKGAASAK